MKKQNKYIEHKNYYDIELYESNSYKVIAHAKISKQHKEMCKKIFWRLSEYGYARGYYNGKDIFLHKYITQTDKSILIDHINRDKLDCRIENLRVANFSINTLNRETPTNSKTGHKGISYDKRKEKYRAYIKINGKQLFLGYFDDIEKAIIARRASEKTLMWQFKSKIPVVFDDIEGECK